VAYIRRPGSLPSRQNYKQTNTYHYHCHIPQRRLTRTANTRTRTCLTLVPLLASQGHHHLAGLDVEEVEEFDWDTIT